MGSMTLHIKNARFAAFPCWLEPWGDYFDIAPDRILTLVSSGPHGEYLELVFDDDRITTWSDSGCTIEPFDAQGSIVPGRLQSAPVPLYPPNVGPATRGLPPSDTRRAELLLHNHSQAALTLFLPSEAYTFGQGDRCLVVVEANTDGPVRVEIADDAICIRGWDGSQVQALGDPEDSDKTDSSSPYEGKGLGDEDT